MNLKQVVERFPEQEFVQWRKENVFQCKCPAHDDNKPSLTITEVPGRIVLYCHAGCDYRDILEAVGLEPKDLLLTPSHYAEKAGDFGPLLRNATVIYDYYKPNGEYAYSKLRDANKRIRYGSVKYDDNGRPVSMTPSAKAKRRYLYNAAAMQYSLENTPEKPIYYVEGEKDADTLILEGLVAVTAGSTGDWKRKFAEQFKGASVVILPDNDEAGRKLADQVAADIKGVCSRYKIVQTSQKPKGDVTDYLTADGVTLDDLETLVDAVSWSYSGGSGFDLDIISGEELLTADLPPVQYVVDGLLPTGVAILAAPSKAGKSWMMLQLALATAGGETFLGMETHGNHVAYFALEDSKNRLQSRLKSLLGSNAVPSGIYFVTEAPGIAQGLLVKCEEMVHQDKNLKLIILDTLQKVKPPSNSKVTAYEQDYQLFAQIGEFARKNRLCVLVVHHTRKTNGLDNRDPFENILGSTALQGATDTMMVLQRDKRFDDTAVLLATGRDIEQQDIALRREGVRWISLGDAAEVERVKLQNECANHPAIITLKKKLKESPIGEYVVRASDFRKAVEEETGKLIGNSDRNFMTEVSRFDPLLKLEDIEHFKPDGKTTRDGKKGSFHTYILNSF